MIPHLHTNTKPRYSWPRTHANTPKQTSIQPQTHSPVFAANVYVSLRASAYVCREMRNGGRDTQADKQTESCKETSTRVPLCICVFPGPPLDCRSTLALAVSINKLHGQPKLLMFRKDFNFSKCRRRNFRSFYHSRRKLWEDTCTSLHEKKRGEKDKLRRKKGREREARIKKKEKDKARQRKKREILTRIKKMKKEIIQDKEKKGENAR